MSVKNPSRRSFMSGAAGVAAGAAVATPIADNIAAVFSIPRELKQEIVDGSTIMKASLVELVAGRRVACKDHATLDLILRGNVESPAMLEVLAADQMSWNITREMVVTGIRIFGGKIAGRPYQNFAWFSDSPKVKSGDRLTVNYQLNFGIEDVMTEENRERPLRDFYHEGS